MRYEYIGKDELIVAVEEHIASIVGSGTLNILNMYLAMNNASLEALFEKPEEISRGLDAIFGTGSCTIKKEIVNVLYTICRMKVNTCNFEDVIRDIKRLIKD